MPAARRAVDQTEMRSRTSGPRATAVVDGVADPPRAVEGAERPVEPRRVVGEQREQRLTGASPHRPA